MLTKGICRLGKANLKQLSFLGMRNTRRSNLFLHRSKPLPFTRITRFFSDPDDNDNKKKKEKGKGFSRFRRRREQLKEKQELEKKHREAKEKKKIKERQQIHSNNQQNTADLRKDQQNNGPFENIFLTFDKIEEYRNNTAVWKYYIEQRNRLFYSATGKEFDEENAVHDILPLTLLVIFFYVLWKFLIESSDLDEKTLINEYLLAGRVEKITMTNITMFLDSYQKKNRVVLKVLTDNGTFYVKSANITELLLKIDKISKEENFELPEITNETIASNNINPIIKIYIAAIAFKLIRNFVSYKRMAIKVASKNAKGKGTQQTKNQFANKMFNQSTTKQYTPEMVNVKFSNVAGLGEVRKEVVEFVDFLKNPKKYQNLGARIPRGGLLTGPPGTGKTLLAKACAGEAGVPFFFCSGSEFVEMYVGLGAKRVRELFTEARKEEKAIIFIDEIDAIGKKRGNFGSNDEREATLNQLLVEMDGFKTKSNIIVFGATNRKDILDPALTRPGRFDRIIDINLPDLEARKEIAEVHLKPLKLSEKKTLLEHAKRVATLTPGFSGSDISTICNEAAILAARENLAGVDPHNFEMAIERIIGGIEVKKNISKEERTTVAFHESGHAVVGWFLEGGSPLIKLTIIPRSKGALGFAQYLPSETSLQTKQELLDNICVILGGRCAERHFFGNVTTGAFDDLQKAYKYAMAIVGKMGMSEELGYSSFKESEYGKKQYSEETNKEIDNAIFKILEEMTERTMKLIIEKEDSIKGLAERLLEKNTLELKEIAEILGPRPFAPEDIFKEYLKEMNLNADGTKNVERSK